MSKLAVCVLSVVQGGYNLTSIADSMYECVSVMLGQSPSRLESSISVHAEYVDCNCHCKYCSCMVGFLDFY
jgi:acetoin utilization deacetylase AcuC-like enzyme